MELTPRELAAILTGLRLLQLHDRLPHELDIIQTNGGELTPLDGDEIDKLCEQLNSGSTKQLTEGTCHTCQLPITADEPGIEMQCGEICHTDKECRSHHIGECSYCPIGFGD